MSAHPHFTSATESANAAMNIRSAIFGSNNAFERHCNRTQTSKIQKKHEHYLCPPLSSTTA